jgi:type IV pilus assembly protein PilC
MIGVAEESGRLPETLKLLGEQLGKSYDLRRKIIGAMIYPVIIITAIFIVGVLMLIFLIPTLATTFRELNVPLPFSTQLIIGLSDFVSNNLLLCGAALVALIGGAYYFSRTKLGHWLIDRVVLLLPVTGTLSRQYNSAAIMRTLSSLISAGVSMVESLRITHKTVNNGFYQVWLAKAMDQVQQGLPLGSAFGERADLFPSLAIEMAQVGEETGKLPEMLLRGAVFFEAEVDQATKNLSTIIEPVLMVIIGIAVGFFAVAMLGPMYSLSSAIK